MIKLIALDLDGTTLNRAGHLSKKTKQTLESVIDRGVHVVIATGRVQSALPKELLDMNGIRYSLTSNGASIISLETKTSIYNNFIEEDIVETLVKILKRYDYMTEVFTEGRAYIENSIYADIKENGSAFNNTEYLLSTREPIEDLFGYILDRKNIIENINLNFTDQNERRMMKGVLEEIEGISVTSSFSYNLEICGQTTSKGEALSHLCKMLNITRDQVMACGDSYNDIEMLSIAGVSIAMENASDEVKAVAKYIAPTNEEDGVARVIEHFGTVANNFQPNNNP